MPAVHTTQQTKIKPLHKPLHKNTHSTKINENQTTTTTMALSPSLSATGAKDTAQSQGPLRPLAPSSIPGWGLLPSQKLLSGGECPMNNHRETTTGTRAHSGGEMGWGARRTWWVRKQRAKSTRERGWPSGQWGLEVGVEGGWATEASGQAERGP